MNSALSVRTLTDGGQSALEVAQLVAEFLGLAERTLDIAQYDFHLLPETSAVVGGAIRAAAKRGVRIRFLYNVDHRFPIPVPPRQRLLGRAAGLSRSNSAIALSWETREATPISMGPPTTVIAPVMINDWPRAESLTVDPNAIATTPAPAIKIPKTSRIKDILAPTKAQNTHGESP